MNRKFPKEIQMAKKYMKKYSIFLNIKEIQIKMTLRFHLTPVRMVVINNKCWQRCGGKRILIHCWWERKLA
jgi:hypothetical protein